MKKKKLKLKKETKKSIAIVINMILIILGILGYISHIKEFGRFDFQYYTLDCNLFAMIVEMILIYYMTLEDKVPKWVQLLKYMSILALVVTFFNKLIKKDKANAPPKIVTVHKTEMCHGLDLTLRNG